MSEKKWYVVQAFSQYEARVKKTLEEAGDKVDDAEKTSIEAAIADVEETAKEDDIEAINAKVEVLMQASHKLAEKMYAENAEAAPSEDAPQDDNVVDGEFEEVKDDESEKKDS